jgi:protein-tyrosine-phosphatase/predicted ATP-grasp superfamily ATP-dependent carboligase
MTSRGRSLRILVTDAHTLAGLGVVRSLGRAGHRVCAAYPEGLDRPASTWSRYCAGVVSYPHGQYDQFAFRAWVLDQAARGVFDAVVPVTEASVLGVAAVRKDLPDRLLAVLPSDAALEYSLSKLQATRMALSLGIPCPATIFVHDGTPGHGWRTDLSALSFPIVIKTDNHLTEDGVYDGGRTFVAADEAGAEAILVNIARVGPRVIAQERIPGSGAGAFLLRFNGKTRLSFAHRRLHEVPYTGGMSSFREGCHDPELVRLADLLLGAIDYDGVAMVEFRRSARDGTPYFLEINGRFWGSLALALHSGVDFPAALIECYQRGDCSGVAGQYPTRIRCRNIFPGEVGHVLSVLRRRAAGVAAPSPSKAKTVARFFLLSLDPTIRHDNWWWSDPWPAIRQAGQTMRWLSRRLLAEARAKLRQAADRRLLSRVADEHRARSQTARYFDRPTKRILFVCYGNICRSPFAAEAWNSNVPNLAPDGSTAFSAGFVRTTGRKTPRWVAKLAAEHGVDLTRHRSRVLTRPMVEAADVIFVMDHRNYREVVGRFPTARAKTHFLGAFAGDDEVEIVDPYSDDPYSEREQSARRCYHKLMRALDGLRARILIDEQTSSSHGLLA